MSYADKVVKINAQMIELDWSMPYKIERSSMAFGSGFFMDTKGHILTCAHVVINAQEISVEIPKYGERRFEADVLGICPQLDIAMLKLRDSKVKIGAFKLGDSSKIKSGDETFAIGFPLSLPSLKITRGIISGKAFSMFQMDTAINPGNSGGPLIKGGKVIGINQGAFVNAVDMNLSVPINQIKLIKEDLYKRRHLIHRPFIGIEYNNLDPSTIKLLNSKCNSGIYISRVYKGSPLDKAGVKEGDILCKIGRHVLDNYGQMSGNGEQKKMSLYDMINTIPNGGTVSIQFWSGKKLIKSKLKLTPYQLPIDIVYPLYQPFDYELFGGLVVMKLTINHIKLFEQNPLLSNYLIPKNRMESKLIISSVLPGSYIQTLDVVHPSQFIEKVNGKRVKTVPEYRKALLNPIKKGKQLLIQFGFEDGGMITIPVETLLQQEPKLMETYGYPVSQVTVGLIQKHFS